MNKIIQVKYKRKFWWFTIKKLFNMNILTLSTWGKNERMLITTDTRANEATDNSKGKVRMQERSNSTVHKIYDLCEKMKQIFKYIERLLQTR